MTDKQPEALRLADQLEEDYSGSTWWQNVQGKAAAELRRLHEVNVELVEALSMAAQYTALLDDFTQDAIRSAIAKATGEQQ
jgi:hypothetical protein